MEVCDTSDHARVDSFRQGMTEEEVLEQCLRGEPAIGNSFEKVKLLDRRDGYEGASMREEALMRQITNCSVWKWIGIFALRRNSHITGCMMELSRIGRFLN